MDSPVKRATGQSILAGGRGSSGNAQSYRDPPDGFHPGPAQGPDDARRPCASGSSVRGGGHSGSVSCSFVPAPDAGEKKQSPLEKLSDLFKKLFAALEHASPRGRVATGDSSRSSGSTHSGSGQGRIGAEEPPQA
ncbi:hypothetical protein ACQKGO_16390 [Corallococcus interemptor]|uniref:hypothetical protein n=1 Tax=Corallococcus interemptor TaxID=2316720 RepID=UPI003D05A1EB